MPGRIDFEVSLSAAGDTRDGVPRRSETMRILVLGDFSGRRNRRLESTADLAGRPIMAVDLDSFDTVFRRSAPCLSLGAGSGGDSGVAVKFESLDDFHPDRLYGALEPFRKLRESRARLLDPASFEQEAARLMESSPPPSGAADPALATAPSRAEDQADLLQRLIGAPAEPAAEPAPSHSLVDGLIRRLVQPHIKPGFSRSPAPYVAAVDASLSDLMRRVLHDADFQALEAAWRGVRRLVDSLELGGEIKLCIADVSKGELLEDLAASKGNPQDCAVHRLLVEASHRGADEQPWSLLVGQYSFGADPDDIALLGYLGVIASQAGGPLLASADSSLVGCDALSERTEPRDWAFRDPEGEMRWNALRRSPAAPWLGLAMPRVLLRLPYGAKTEPLESFSFEEFATTADHEAYLWGNPALACAQVIARTFLDEDQDTSIEGPHEIDDLPAHVRDHDDERQLQACAEFVLPARVGEEMQRRGMIPVLSYGNRNAVRVLRVQSIAEPLGSLARLG
jgi:type VI secretion system protein ImpC